MTTYPSGLTIRRQEKDLLDLSFSNGLRLKIDQNQQSIIVQIDRNLLADQSVSGLCGDLNKNPEDDLKLWATGELTRVPVYFGNQWKLDRTVRRYSLSIKRLRVCVFFSVCRCSTSGQWLCYYSSSSRCMHCTDESIGHISIVPSEGTSMNKQKSIQCFSLSLSLLFIGWSKLFLSSLFEWCLFDTCGREFVQRYSMSSFGSICGRMSGTGYADLMAIGNQLWYVRVVFVTLHFRFFLSETLCITKSGLYRMCSSMYTNLSKSDIDYRRTTYAEQSMHFRMCLFQWNSLR